MDSTAVSDDEPDWSKKPKDEELQDLDERLCERHVTFRATIIKMKLISYAHSREMWRAVICDGKHATYIYCFDKELCQGVMEKRKYRFINVKVKRVREEYEVYGYLKYELEIQRGSEIVETQEEPDQLPDAVYATLDLLPMFTEKFVSCVVVVKQKYPPKKLDYSGRWCQLFLVCDSSSFETAIELFGDTEDFGKEFLQHKVLVLDRVKMYGLWHRIWLKGGMFSTVSVLSREKMKNLREWYKREGKITNRLFEKFVSIPVKSVEECNEEQPLVTVNVEILNVELQTYMGCPKINCRRAVRKGFKCMMCVHVVKVEAVQFAYLRMLVCLIDSPNTDPEILYFLHESDNQSVESYSGKKASIVLERHWEPEQLVAVRIDVDPNCSSNVDDNKIPADDSDDDIDNDDIMMNDDVTA